jgi:hypothetical protein
MVKLQLEFEAGVETQLPFHKTMATAWFNLRRKKVGQSCKF